MLQVTDAAAAVFRQVLSPERNSTTAIRIHSTMTPEGQPAIAFQPTQGPLPGDAPTAASDLDVYVAEELAQPLSDAILDARETPEGTEMFLRSQEEEGA
ncbi:MAG: hypothetical protein HY658_00045 [Actinobacteria bacterium]|nr:hypothetical protein [Actinomycetota bacterium]